MSHGLIVFRFQTIKNNQKKKNENTGDHRERFTMKKFFVECRMCSMYINTYQYAIHNGTTNEQFSIVSKKQKKKDRMHAAPFSYRKLPFAHIANVSVFFSLLCILASFVRPTIQTDPKC